MKLCKLLLIALVVALITPAVGLAQKQRSCSRDGLKRMTDLYVTAQTKGDISGLPMAQAYHYMENIATIDINKGIIRKPMKIDFHRSI